MDIDIQALNQLADRIYMEQRWHQSDIYVYQEGEGLRYVPKKHLIGQDGRSQPLFIIPSGYQRGEIYGLLYRQAALKMDGISIPSSLGKYADLWNED